MCCTARHPLVVGDLGLLVMSVGAATASYQTQRTVLSHAIWYVAVADVRRVKKFACRTRARQLHVPHTDRVTSLSLGGLWLLGLWYSHRQLAVTVWLQSRYLTYHLGSVPLRDQYEV